MPKRTRKNEFFQTGTIDETEIPVSANALTRAVLEYLATIGVKAWRNNVGGARLEGRGNARGRFVRFGEKGAADIFAVCPPMGRFLAIEIKAGKDKMSEAQTDWHLAIRNVGGATIVAHTIDDVMEYFENERLGIGI